MREYKAGGRNGYHAVDEFEGSKWLRMIVAVKSKNTAELIAGALSEAYKHGKQDARADMLNQDSLGEVLAGLDLYIPGLSYQETAQRLADEL